MTIELLDWDRTVRLTPSLADQFPAIAADPIAGSFGQEYFPRYSAEPCRQFAILVSANKTLGLIILGIVEDGLFHLGGHPARFFWAKEIGSSQKAAVAKVAFDYLDTLAKAEGVRQFSIEEIGSPRDLSQIELRCLNRGGSLVPKLVGNVDLRRATDDIWRDVRKSYRPLIKRGAREMTLHIVDAGNPCKALFDRFREFHYQVSGRRARSAESWDIQFDFVARGMGSLVVGFQDSELVSGTLSVDGDDVSYYATGVYDRERFHLPIAHAPVWRSILAAKDRGRKTYCLGDIYPNGAGTAKECSIGRFKKGFTDTLAVSRVWRWSPRTEGSRVRQWRP